MSNNERDPKTTADSPDMRRCSRCGKAFGSRTGADQHIATVHQGKGHRVSVHRHDEESMADIAVEAEIKRMGGERLDPLEESLLS